MKSNGLTSEREGSGKVIPIPPLPKAIEQRGRARRGLCIPCAVADEEFKERAPASGTAPLEEEETRAWIGGRSFELLRHPAARVACIRCGREVSTGYAPEEERTA